MRHTVLVTGGAGFIGSHVVDRFVARGYDVHVIDDLSAGDRKFVNPKAVLHVMDVRSPRLGAFVKKLRPDSVVHLAAKVDLRESMRSPLKDADVNIMGSLNLLQACLALKKVPHLVFSSTAAVYTGICHRTSEAEQPVPTSPYGISKLAFEHYLRFAAEHGDMKSAVLRFANVYGPRQTPKGEAGVVAIFTDLLLDGKTAVINGDGRQIRDFVYVEDVADMVALASERSAQGTFNVSTGVETSVNALYKEVAAALGDRRKAKHGPPKAGDVRCVTLDPSRAGKRLGWKPKVDVREGIGRTVEWAAERRRGASKDKKRSRR